MGFTRVELAAVCAILTLGVFTLAPALALGKAEADTATCLNNQRQLILAWQAFTADHNEKMPGVTHGGISQAANSMITPAPPGSLYDSNLAVYRPWATGWLDWTPSPQNTNYNHLTNPALSSLAIYLNRRREAYKCPADRYLSRTQTLLGWRERIRTYSGNIAVGDGNGADGPWGQFYLKARKLSDLVIPEPQSTYVYIEEHPDSMADVGFFSPNGAPGALNTVDVPANFHDGGGSLSFADGHVELHRWSGSFRSLVVTASSGLGNFTNHPGDLKYLFDRTPRTQP